MKIINTTTLKSATYVGAWTGSSGTSDPQSQMGEKMGKATNTHKHTFSQNKGPGQTESKLGNTPVHFSQSPKQAGENTQAR